MSGCRETRRSCRGAKKKNSWSSSTREITIHTSPQFDRLRYAWLFCLRAIRDESAATTWCSQNCDSQLDWWFDCWPPLAKWFIWFYFIWKQKLIAAAAVAEILHNWWRLTPRLLSIETSVSVYSGTETSPEGRHWVNTFRSKKVFWDGKKLLIDLLGCRQEVGRVGVFKTSLKSFWSVQLNFAISPKPFYLQTSVIAACETS